MDIIFPETCVAKANRYWRRRKYQKLPKRRKLSVLKLGVGGREPNHRLRHTLKSVRKLKLRVFLSPIRVLVKIREGYVNMMLRWAGKLGMGRVSLRKSKRSQVMIEVGGQQVDARLVMEIYNRLMVAERELSD